MRTIRWCSLTIALFATTLFAADIHLAFNRTVPPPIDLAPARRLTVVEAVGSDAVLDSLIDRFVDYVDEAGALQIDKTRGARLESLDEPGLKRLRRHHPADLYVSVTLFNCRGMQHRAEGSERDASGERVKRVHTWVDVGCEVHLEIRHPDGHPFVSFTTRGEGTSPRVEELTSDERDIAYQQAARYAALSAAEMITPRIVRDSIDLDENAPRFEEALTMIQSERFGDARAVWEAALPLHRDSAALQYDLAAVCEATGDFSAARHYLQSAVRLSPHNRRYLDELQMLQRRVAGK